LIARHLGQHSIPFRRIDGECTLPRRRKILNEFSTKTSMPVLIMTTGTGAFGYVLFPGQTQLKTIYAQSLRLTFPIKAESHRGEPHLHRRAFVES